MVRPPSTRSDLRDRLAAGRVVGTFLKLPALETVDIAWLSGLDFGLVDLEHSQLSEADALRLVRHGAALGLAAVVRVPTCDRGLINRLLEAGADGIQLSAVRSVPQVRELVSATRYPPHGQRSISVAHPTARYGAVAVAEAVAAPHPLLIGQIETAETVDPLKDIVAAGLDVAFLGMTDLEVDLGFDAQRLRERVEVVREAADACGAALGAFAGDPAEVPAGVRYVAVSSDVAQLRSGMNLLAERAREGPT
jgi:4-hydroxy-2-oxoheptanedioate aldolase